MNINKCKHVWKIHVGASRTIDSPFPAIYICEKCNLEMEASVLATEKLSISVDKLKDEIQKYSESSDKHSNAIKWLTSGLITVGLLQVIVYLLRN